TCFSSRRIEPHHGTCAGLLCDGIRLSRPRAFCNASEIRGLHAMSFRRPIASTVLILAGIGALVYACGIDITFRAYLDKRLWRPTVRPIADLVKDLPPERTAYVPYAGMASPD